MDNNIYVRYGSDGKSITKELLSIMKIEELIPSGSLIAIKPNLVVAGPSSDGATTDPAIVRGIIEYLKNKGFNNIEIIESSWLGTDTAHAFQVCGYNEISKEYNIPLYDLKKDSTGEITVKDLKLKICNRALKADFLINVPVV